MGTFTSRTWLDDSLVEGLLHATLSNVDENFSTWFTEHPLALEEEHDGALTILLSQASHNLRGLLSNWKSMPKTNSWSIDFHHHNTKIRRGEARWRADMAFVLLANVPGVISTEKLILVQSKKMHSDGHSWHLSWDLDYAQAEELFRNTPSSYYFLYSPNLLGGGIKVIPCKTILDVTSATKIKTVINDSWSTPSSRPFSDFLLYDFIGCWVGDHDNTLIRKVTGRDPEIGATHIITVKISRSEQSASQSNG